MLNRATVSLSLALLAVIATTGAAQAATDTERVAVGTFLVAVLLMIVISIVYVLKRAFGLETKLPPPEPDAGHGSGH
jgi:hypothetical protein